MRNRFRRVNSILYWSGSLLQILGVVILCPVPIALVYWGKYGDGWNTIWAFIVPAAISFAIGQALRWIFKPVDLDTTASMLMCALGWLLASALGAIPFVIGIDACYLDGYFEAMSGFTTTGITVFDGLDTMPRSIIFWRALTQWVGGLGIISFFLAITFKGAGAHQLLGAESHKISSGRPAPGLFNTLKILWGIYGGLTVGSVVLLVLQRMSVFDSICHVFTALSTGGFSPYDASIAYYQQAGHPHYKMIEYTLTFVMLLGGMNFLIHYRVVTRDFKALWDNIETRYWWWLIAGFTGIILFDHLLQSGYFANIIKQPNVASLGALEEGFRHAIFQVVSIITTTGFGTRDIGTYPSISMQLFLVMMVIGGCVGSTGGGIKVMRVAVLSRMVWRELFKLRVSPRTSTPLVIDGKVVPTEELQRIAALFFAWMALLVLGGAITAILSPGLSPWSSFSGMFSALGNIGPCYISVPEMIKIHWGVKVTYIFGMLAGRLEILPVLLLFSPRAWR